MKKNNEHTKKIIPSTCTSTCTSSADSGAGLFLRNKELSYYVAGGLLGIFVIFMAGFFWGQQYAIDNFIQKLNRDSFADQVASSLYTGTFSLPVLSAAFISQESLNQESLNIEPTLKQMSEQVSPVCSQEQEKQAIHEVKTVNPYFSTEAICQDIKDIHKQENQKNGKYTLHKNDSMLISPVYSARLIGFSTLSAAHQFVHRITKKGFPVKVQKRISKTAKGKKIVWYQVVTDTFVDKEYLKKMVDILVKQEKLKDVLIWSH